MQMFLPIECCLCDQVQACIAHLHMRDEFDDCVANRPKGSIHIQYAVFPLMPCKAEENDLDAKIVVATFKAA